MAKIKEGEKNMTKNNCPQTNSRTTKDLRTEDTHDWNLSSKIEEGSEEPIFTDFIFKDDVKEFARRLKDEVIMTGFSSDKEENRDATNEILGKIDKLLGKELSK